MTLNRTSEVESFKQESDKIAADVNRNGYLVNNFYTDAQDTNAAHHQAIRATLKADVDAGNLWVHFLGHSGQYIWHVEPMGDLFTLDDVSAMTNAGRDPMALGMTCFSAPFDDPTADSIGERFLREADKGAVAVFAAKRPVDPRGRLAQLHFESPPPKAPPWTDAGCHEAGLLR